MPRNKRTLWLVAAGVTAVLFFGLDAWQQLTASEALAPIARAAKLVYVVLLALSVWLGAANAGSRTDWRRLSLAFALVVAGDTLFFLRMAAYAIATFMLAQVVLAWRNGRGLASLARQGRWRDHRRHLGLTSTGCVVAVGLALTVFAVCTKHALSPRLMALGALYAVFLGASLWVAWLSPLADSLPRARAWQTAWAMALFFCCDVTVGLGHILGGTSSEVARLLTWIFYAPALWLLVASGRRVRSKNPAPI